jgi:PAS domain S-box-containing protein
MVCYAYRRRRAIALVPAAVLSVVRGVLSMEIVHKRRSRSQAVAVQFLLGIVGLALITFICFRLEFGLARTGFSYVILVALVSLLGSFTVSVVLSIVAAACLNYFFAPPLFEFRIDVPEDIERIAAFLTTSLLVTALTTKRNRAEAELRKSKVRLEEAQRIAHVGWWDRDIITGYVTVSDEVCRILGVRPVAQWLNLIHPEDRTRAAEAAEAALRPGGPRYDVEYRVIRPDGALRVVHSHGDVTRDASGRPLRKFGVLQDITALRQAEQKLLASEARFRTFVDHAMDGFFLFDEHQAILDVNRQACDSLGYSREEMIGMHPRDFDAGLDAASIARIGERVTTGETVTFESLHRRKDGTVFPVEIRAHQFQQGAYRFRLSLARDITERKRAEEALRENEAKLQNAQRIAHFGWWERDFSTSRVSLSDEVCRIFGLQPVELPEWHGRWLSLIHPEDRPRAAEAAAAALLPGGPRYDIEYRVVRPDGTERIIHSQGDVTLDESERPLRQFGVLQDITKLRRAEKELRASEVRFRTFVDQATDAFFLLDDQLAILDVNRQACHSLRYSREELIGKHPREFDVDLDEAGIQRLRHRILAGETVTFETHHRHKDGTAFPVEIRASQFEQGGRRILCLARDITERKRAEDELRASEERFRTLVQLSFDVYWESDVQHRFVRQEFAEGLADAPEADSEIGKTRWEVPYLEPDEEAWRRHRSTLDAHMPFRDFELARPAPDGGKRYVSVSGLPVFDSTGQFIGYRGVGRHITEAKRAAEALREAQTELAHANRVATMGQLSASVAHEVSQPISAVRINASAALNFLDSHPPDLNEVREALDCIVIDADRARDIIDRIRDQIKKAPPRKGRFDLNVAVDEVIALAQNEIAKNGVSVETCLSKELSPVEADRVQVQQVVLNLILNAVEAMSTLEEGPRGLLISTEQSQGDVLVKVCDSGPGVDPKNVEHVFEAFYTTKSSGVGMGLSICRSIINAHGGHLWVEANEPNGAVFQFRLPVANQPS